ncbi:MAG: hypothetical protein ACXVRE_08675 [Gaiellaceae bacterium]
MSEQDQHLEPEDVEAHQHLNRNLNANLGHEDDDVEAHQNKNRNQGKDEGDDVEAHVHRNVHRN